MRPLAIAGLVLLVSAPVSGQSRDTMVWPVSTREATAPELPGRSVLSTPAGAFTASLLLPGAGQAALGQRRWALYAALEVTFWAVRLEAESDRRAAGRAYRDLAWDVARLPGSAPRVDGSWGYYETMGQYARSGAYDSDPALEGVQPETDPATYNGTVWALSRALFLPDGEGEPGTPEYDRALAHYDARAASPAFLWSWEGNEAAWGRYGGLIDEADHASRVAGRALGAVLANHFVSAVDALLTARLRNESRPRLESRIAAVRPLQWSVGVRVPIKDRK